MSDKPDSSLTRMLAVLDLFDEQRLAVSVETVMEALEVSQPTAYRYLKVLVGAGLLQRRGSSHFGLGARIVFFDHLIRRADPVLQHAVPFMKELVATTGLDCVATALLGAQMLDIHREYSGQPASLSYGRGRPRPLLRGAAPKVILAQMPAAALRRVLEAQAGEVAAAGLPADWPSQRRAFQRIRKAGFYHSVGELEPNLSAIAAPMLDSQGRAAGALSLVTTVQRMAVIDAGKLAAMVVRAAGEISARLGTSDALAAPGQGRAGPHAWPAES